MAKQSSQAQPGKTATQSSTYPIGANVMCWAGKDSQTHNKHNNISYRIDRLECVELVK